MNSIRVCPYLDTNSGPLNAKQFRSKFYYPPKYIREATRYFQDWALQSSFTCTDYKIHFVQKVAGTLSKTDNLELELGNLEMACPCH